ncbi:MAG: hypothetical protein GVY13_19345 [Alphaproteobacteria bacterium]|jgi:hypothetical protein|nr:hypothetical protein [Alphaproteobacteria bacterium]
MKIEEWSRTVIRLSCRCGERFVVRRLGPSVECPVCGRVATAADLTDEYCSRGAGGPAE